MENKNVELVKFCEFLIGLFEDEKSTVDELLDRRFEDEFIYYGFDANSYPFAEKYKINIESEALSILDKVDDMQLLGSLIFAYWRHFEHWSHNLEEIYSERKWFVATLTKLKELAEEQVKVKEQNDKIVFKYYTGGYGPSNEQFEEHLIITPDFIIYKKKRNSHKPYGYDDSDISLTLSKGPYGFNDCFLRVSSYLDIIKSFIPTIEIFDASCLKISVNKINGTRFKYDLYPSECEKELIDIRNMILPYFDELLFPEFLRPSVDDDCEDDDEYDGGNK